MRESREKTSGTIQEAYARIDLLINCTNSVGVVHELVCLREAVARLAQERASLLEVEFSNN